jgi:hypothetical protein
MNFSFSKMIIVATAAVCMAGTAHAWPSNLTAEAVGRDGNPSSKHLIDAHEYRHCHVVHTRTYCHKRERLPMNIPPLSDTPHGRAYEIPPEPPRNAKPS